MNYLNFNAQNEFIALLGTAVHQSILDDIRAAPFISVTTDSTSDLSHKEIYSIIIRFAKDFHVEERVIAVTEMASKVGKDICDYIIE